MWKDILSMTISGLLVASIVAGFLWFFLRKPDFTLTLELNMVPETDEKLAGVGRLDFILKNNKTFQYYNAGEVYYHLYFPKSILAKEDDNGRLVQTKNFVKGINTPVYPIRDLNYEWTYNIPKDSNEEYFELRETVDANIFPNRTIPLLSMGPFLSREFNKEKPFKVYYWFSTKYGNFPRGVKIDNIEKIRDVLPFAEVDIAEYPL